MKNLLPSLVQTQIGKGLTFAFILILSLSTHCLALNPIDSTAVVSIGDIITLDPWATICRVYGQGELNGYISETTECKAEDAKAFDISEKKRTKTLYYYKGWRNGFYSSYYVKALKIGEYTITAGARCHKTRPNSHALAFPVVRYKLIVTEKVTSISIPTNLTFDVGETYIFSPVLNEEGKGARLTWTSSSPSIVSVNEGEITALANGTAIITCTAANGVYAQCVVTVNAVKANSISLNTSEVTIEEGMRYQLEATILPENAANKEVRWTCSNEDVALVNSNGMIIGFSSGDCEITATTVDGSNLSANCKIHIVASTPRVITAKSYTQTYGMRTPQTFEYTIEGEELIGKPEITCEVTQNTPVGTYPIKISKGSIANSNVTYIDGTFTVTKAPLNITAESCFRKIGEENPAFEVTYSGFMNKETDSVLTAPICVTTNATETSPCGKYEIKITGGTAANYDVKYINGILTIIEPKEVEISNPIAGLLPTLISVEDKYAITKLTISGLLNGTDIKYIREMIINGYLTELDIENTSIVEGGEAYENGNYYTRNNWIQTWTFHNCKNLQKLILPKTITNIGSWPFEYCGIQTLVVPSTTTCLNIWDRAFACMNNLYNIVIPYTACPANGGFYFDSINDKAKNIIVFTPHVNLGVWISNADILYNPTTWNSWNLDGWGWFDFLIEGKDEEYIQNHIKPLFTFKSVPLSETSVKIECFTPEIFPDSYIDKYQYIINGKIYETVERSIVINDLTTEARYDTEVHIYPANREVYKIDDYVIENFSFTMAPNAISDVANTKWDIQLRNNAGILQVYVNTVESSVLNYSLCSIDGCVVATGRLIPGAGWQDINTQIPHGLYLLHVSDGKQTRIIKTLIK